MFAYDQHHENIDVSWADDGISSGDVDVGVDNENECDDNQGEDDDNQDEEDDHCIDCPDSESDNDCLEDNGEEENDEQDGDENHEDFTVDLLEASDSICSDPATWPSRVDNDPGSSVTEQQNVDTTHPWAGFKIVGDNVDKTFVPVFRDQIGRLSHYTTFMLVQQRTELILVCFQILYQVKW